ncbi:ABC transporter, integral membrane type 1 [Penicillium expansum]|uniref:ABC transporter, integral membrane type 1 n=1 Tax=Penicillium expansum TaxID=27334 RepID=A0A0A2JIJ3_PENEN|nr:ABC transporter, integral membrane type 1 [Penicillium expansum]KGO55164.1 ABC transporter, integral membrane type 1 [Penicillium expansum]
MCNTILKLIETWGHDSSVVNFQLSISQPTPQAAIHMTHAIISKSEQWWCGQAVVFFVVGSFFTHTVIFISLLDTNPAPSIAQFVPWLSAIPFEVAILSTSVSIYSHTHHEPTIEDPFGGKLRTKITFWEALEISAGSVRIFVLALLVASYTFRSARKHRTFKEAEEADTGETTNLLDSRGNANSDDSDALTDGQQTPEVEAWRAVNILVPYQVGVIADSLSASDGTLRVPWMPILSQYAYMELSTAAFEHVHNLGLDFHLGKKMGEVLSALTKGSSINTFLEQVTFQVLPMFIDLAIAIGYFLVVFDVYYALAVAIMTFFYLYSTVKIASWRANMRRQMVNASRQEDAVKNDSLVSYETVKYFNAEEYEFNRYRGAVSDYLRAEWHSLFAQNLMNIFQNVIFMLGLLITCFICAYQVARGQRAVGQFVTLLTYMAQLQAPLNIFGTFYRYIQSALINAERLLELFRVQPSVVDAPSATPLAVCHGRVTFNDIQFSYDTRKPALDGLTFDCKPGTTTALVGESGGGKSTIFRLLYRFYNPNGGSILIDGHDTQTLTIDSVRRHIGIVPQDTVLFNETIMYNLKYANQDATDEEVYEACRAASVHEKIMAFPDGYETKVGDRGLRLSGGEKQRVAIARTIIKKPQIILLDEATAALDSETEQNIQEALSVLSRGRTVLVIAHRLSTITAADNIVVLHEGRVAESGTHEQLLASHGRYTTMWQKQIRAQTESVGLEALSGKI